jgi:hypothetical protein
VDDAELSGSVNAADYSFTDNGYSMKLTGWINGDFNYDGTVNPADYSLIDKGFAFSAALPAAPLAAAAKPAPAQPEGQCLYRNRILFRRWWFFRQTYSHRPMPSRLATFSHSDISLK